MGKRVMFRWRSLGGRSAVEGGHFGLDPALVAGSK
jgi:hypothetical protein